MADSKKVLVRIGNKWIETTEEIVRQNIMEIGRHCYDEIKYED